MVGNQFYLAYYELISYAVSYAVYAALFLLSFSSSFSGKMLIIFETNHTTYLPDRPSGEPEE